MMKIFWNGYRKAKRSCDDVSDFMILTETTHLILPIDKVEKTCLNKSKIIYQDEYYLVLIPMELP